MAERLFGFKGVLNEESLSDKQLRLHNAGAAAWGPAWGRGSSGLWCMTPAVMAAGRRPVCSSGPRSPLLVPRRMAAASTDASKLCGHCRPAGALGSSLLACMVVPWALCLLFYTVGPRGGGGGARVWQLWPRLRPASRLQLPHAFSCLTPSAAGPASCFGGWLGLTCRGGCRCEGAPCVRRLQVLHWTYGPDKQRARAWARVSGSGGSSSSSPGGSPFLPH